ncbi:dTDP-3-amino-3,4,6-trideoxy-alpha-D-glucose transaminase [uncultured Defluviicoccus sp.]|uniref:dTDP-3-amino-3,4,6-trideoxy-alpha-D-glucose transaminase n=1 Tax=metagenome TaxID=256318 RepID=A0A380T941_9ZZZZ|nr:dTDP-3-amino-3,4,6-trideoxy-alpha-D-glucose transaminase [uncultured Defluviicoccus sp.]
MNKKILPADPKAGYLAAQAEIDDAIRRVLQSGHYILGPEVEAFEKEFSAWLGAGGAVTVANGTDALELALRVLGIGPGDKVVTVANTVTATVSAIAATGARAVFVDVDPATMLLDVAALENLLTTLRDPKIKAVVPVHLYGQAVDMPRLMEVAAKHNLAVLEDCAQAHGAAVGGRKAGTWGRLAAFSFYPTKNLGALGDGGAVCGSDAGLLEQVRLLRQYGWRKRYVSELHGRNSRLDEMQSAILRVRLGRLDAENARRSVGAARYLAGLKNAPLTLPVPAEGRTHCWHQFVVRTPRRDDLKAQLEKKGILCGVLYPVPIHRQPAYHDAALSFPHTEQSCAEVLSLPLHPGLSDDDIDRVVREVAGFFAGN